MPGFSHVGVCVTGLTHLCFRVDDAEPVLAAAEAAGGRPLRDTRSVLAGTPPLG